MRSGGGSRWRRYEPRRAAFASARPAQCRTARCSLHWCRRGSSRLHPVVPGSAGLSRAEGHASETAVGRRKASAPAPRGSKESIGPRSSLRKRGGRSQGARHTERCGTRWCAYRRPASLLSREDLDWLAAKLGCGRIARTNAFIRPRDSGGGGPSVARSAKDGGGGPGLGAPRTF
jgi:hypothetical protein